MPGAEAPAAVHVTGPAALVPGEPTVLGCHSGEARPAAQLTVTLTDQAASNNQPGQNSVFTKFVKTFLLLSPELVV